MCFSGGGSSQQTAPTPAPAPPPPEPVATDANPTAARRSENAALFGQQVPNLRIDRSAASAGVTAGGAGLRM